MKRRINFNRIEAYMAAAVIFLMFFAFRLATLRVTNGDPYIAFLPAAILSTFLLGIGPGLLAAVLGGVAGLYYLAPPAFSFHVQQGSDIGDLIVYAGLCLACCLLIHFLRSPVIERR